MLRRFRIERNASTETRVENATIIRVQDPQKESKVEEKKSETRLTVSGGLEPPRENEKRSFKNPRTMRRLERAEGSPLQLKRQEAAEKQK